MIVFYKYKQNSFLGLSEPKIETPKSIVEYAKKNKISGKILIAKDEKSYEVLKKYFNFGNIYVLNKNLELLDCNLESLGGRCFQDIQNDICNNAEIKKREFKNINGEKIIKKLLNNSKSINGDYNIEDYDTIYIYTWVKYAKASINKNSIKFMNCLKNRKGKHLILSVNTDMINFDK